MAADYLQLSDIAAVYGIPLSTARKWACADHWRRKGTRPKRYSVADAAASYSRRHAGRVARHLVNKYGADARGT